MKDKLRVKFWLAALAFTGTTLLLLALAPEEERASVDDIEAPPLLQSEARCALTGELARTRALESERAAHARWERVPYAVGDGVTAVLQLAEAVQCFRVASDREGRARSEGDLTMWNRELERLYARSRLNLVLALRAHDHDAASRQAKALLALLGHAGAGAEPYCSFLKSIERKAQAAAIERLRAAEDG